MSDADIIRAYIANVVEVSHLLGTPDTNDALGALDLLEAERDSFKDALEYERSLNETVIAPVLVERDAAEERSRRLAEALTRIACLPVGVTTVPTVRQIAQKALAGSVAPSDPKIPDAHDLASRIAAAAIPGCIYPRCWGGECAASCDGGPPGDAA